MNTLLKVLGSIVKVAGQVFGFIPLVNNLLPSGAQAEAVKIEDKLQQGLNVIITTEQLFAAAYGPDAKLGSDKLRAATPFIAQIIQQLPALTGLKLTDEAKFEDAVTRITAALADVLNSYGK